MSSLLARGALALALVMPVVAFAADERVATPVNTDPMLTPMGKYNFQTSHSQVGFTILHMGLSHYTGRINKVTGTVDFDPKNPEKSAVTANVDLKDLDTPFFTPTGTKMLDQRICAADAFDCAQFATATFKSTAVKVTGKNAGDVTGNLTLHGVTKPMVLHATFVAGRKSPFGAPRYMIGFSATGTLKRSDFGLNKMSWGDDIADDVNLIIQTELAEASPAGN